MASAEIATFNFTLDQYVSEARWGILNTASSTVAYSAVTGPMYVGSSLVVNTPTLSTTSAGGYTFDVSMDLPRGVYLMVLIDIYGDGWTGGGVSFSDNAVGPAISFPTGSQVAGTFTVVPAPASLALLGLAGLTRRRRS